MAFSFGIVENTATYDLTTVATVPATALTEILLDEITKFTIIASASPLLVAELLPAFTPESLIEMLVNTTLTNPVTGNSNGAPGGRYTLDANDYKTLRIDPPDANYTAYIVGWGMPNPASDSVNDSVPLIPAWGHNTIVDGMNAKIFKYAYGSKNPKTIDAATDYEAGIINLQQRLQFDPNYRTQLASRESAIRST